MNKFFILFIFLIVTACNNSEPVESAPPATPEELEMHSEEFRKEVIEVVDGVHVAIGFALANSMMIEGEGGNIIIDTTGSIETAREVKKIFDSINPNPVAAIIYTHNHADHIYGASVFAEGSDPDVYAHSSTQKYISRVIGILRPIIGSRSNRMFGNVLPKEEVENNGIGPFLEIGRDGRTTGLLNPPTVFDDSLELDIAGVKIVLYHAPGETNDQLLVWLPEKKALFPGDNFYKAFPNLYTIRGTPYRDLSGWVSSLDTMRYLRPKYLIPSHTRPLVGVGNIQNKLTVYRDGIQFVHDQTIRLMNKGLTPDEIVDKISLPPDLADSPFLKELYGSPEWSSRNVFSGYLGWFDGNPSTLNPLSKPEEAANIINLSGGWSKLYVLAEDAFNLEKYQWSLQLTDYLLSDRPNNKKATSLRKSILEKLGEQQANPNARYYYLSSAAELDPNYKSEDILKPTLEILRKYPIEAMLESLKVRVVPNKSLNKNIQLLFKFTDTGKVFSLFLRNSVLEIQPFEIMGSQVQVMTTEDSLKGILAGLKSLPVALATRVIKVEGETMKLITFFGTLKE
jgi:alkyl sulfatase BDS1-like metallo-beta-lactamase superfamily hydrolase